MRVYVPDKKQDLISEALKELYLLRQAVDHQVGTTDSKLAMTDKIRKGLKALLEN